MTRKSPWKFWFANWTVRQRIVLFGLITMFWISGIVQIAKIGNTFGEGIDGTTEITTIYSANDFVKNGFTRNYFLPTYPGHGFDSQAHLRTEPFVYTHYLPAPSWVLGVVFKIFGTKSVWLGRLIPHTLTVLAILFFALMMAEFSKSTVVGCLSGVLFLVPRALTTWSICLYGHSYALAFLIFLLGLLIRMHLQKDARAGYAWLLGLVFGFLQMEFEFDWVPLTFLMIPGFWLVLPGLSRAQFLRVWIGFFLGCCGAAALQMVLVSLYFGSFRAALDDYILWGKWRSSDNGPAEHIKELVQLRVHNMLRMYHAQAYGATGFHALQMVALSILALCLGYAGKVLKKPALWRGVGAVLCFYFAAAAWTIGMRQHSFIHVHFIPRHYIALFIGFVFLSLPVFHDLVQRARRA